MRFLLPVAVLLGLLVLLGVGLTLNPREVPSPLVGRPAPAFDLPRLDDAARLRSAELQGQPRLVNYWASWCTPCLQEHPLLMRLAREQQVSLLGINYKDAPEDASAWLARHGNPYSVVAQDLDGRVGLDWGVYGVPETFVLDAQGVILHKHIGPLTETAWREQIQPLLAGARR
jgi:cytochrome c biogenesis protein CcmG, thiol:disulfide interchange protein DsbE